MNDPTPDFGTGLRAHLGLEQDRLDPVAEPVTLPEPVAEIEEPLPVAPQLFEVDPLFLEDELLERERLLTEREASLAGRAGSLLAAAQALYDEVLGGGTPPQGDELAQLRRRKSVA